MLKLFTAIFFCGCFFYGTDVSAIDAYKADSVISEFASAYGDCSVIIIRPDSGKVEYIFNKSLASRRIAPGSLMKPFSALVFLENRGLFDFDPYKKINCTGRIYLNEKKIIPSDFLFLNIQKDEKGFYLKCSSRDGHGPVDLSMAISSSCNSYFFNYSQKNPYKFLEILTERSALHLGSGSRIVGMFEEKPVPAQPGSYLLCSASAIGEGGMIKAAPVKIAQIYAALLMSTPFLSLFEGEGCPLVSSMFEIDPAVRRMVLSPLTRVMIDGTLNKIKLNNRSIKILAGKSGTSTSTGSVYSNQAWNVILFERNGEKYLMTVFVKKGTGSGEAMILSGKVLDAI